MYPLSLLSETPAIFPLFGDQLTGEPHVFDFSSKNPKTAVWDTADFDAFQAAIVGELKMAGKEWGIGRYLEERSALLRNYPQILEEGRIYHAGLDITAPAGSKIFAPLNSVVFETGKEEGVGNYGGFVILKHQDGKDRFYSFYGHLRTPHIVERGRTLVAGQNFAVIGDGSDSGGWFTHTHLQVITQAALDAGRRMQGYVTVEDLKSIEDIFPPPYPLFRY